MKKGLIALLLGSSMFLSNLSFSQDKPKTYSVYGGFLPIGKVEEFRDSTYFDLGSLGKLEFSKKENKYLESAESKRGKEIYVYSVSDSLSFDDFFVKSDNWDEKTYLFERSDKIKKLKNKFSTDYYLGIDFLKSFEKGNLPDTLNLFLFAEKNVGVLQGEVVKKGSYYYADYEFSNGYLTLPDRKYLSGPLQVKLKKEKGKFSLEEMRAKVIADSFFGELKINLRIKKD